MLLHARRTLEIDTLCKAARYSVQGSDKSKACKLEQSRGRRRVTHRLGILGPEQVVIVDSLVALDRVQERPVPGVLRARGRYLGLEGASQRMLEQRLLLVRHVRRHGARCDQ